MTTPKKQAPLARKTMARPARKPATEKPAVTEKVPDVVQQADQVSAQAPLIKTQTSNAIEAEKYIDEDAGTVRAVDGALETDDSDIEIESNLLEADDRAKALQFMEEFVLIEIAEGQDQNNPEPHVFLCVNGEGAGPGNIPYAPRGRPISIKRKFVEVLARARPASYGNIEKTDPNTGERTFEYPKKTALKYPFTVIEDKNPMGSKWLRQILAER